MEVWERPLEYWMLSSRIQRRTTPRGSSPHEPSVLTYLRLLAWREREEHSTGYWYRLSSGDSLIEANYGNQGPAGSSRSQTRSENEACGT